MKIERKKKIILKKNEYDDDEIAIKVDVRGG